MHSGQIRNYLEKKIDGRISYFPYIIRQPEKVALSKKKLKSGTKVTVSILGSVDEKRRDYFSIFDPLNTYPNLDHIEFILAGVPGGSGNTKKNKTIYFEELKRRLALIEERSGAKFITFDRRLNENDYNNAVINSDVILMPLVTKIIPLGAGLLVSQNI